jgi:nucleotide-binding universal stress UspA family protein
MQRVKRIVVATDFSSCSRDAVDYAVFLAETFGASLDVLHVIWEPPTYVGAEVMVDISGQSRQSLGRFAYNQAEKEMSTVLAEIRTAHDVKLVPRLELGDPPSTILRIAAEDQYDMIVMGTHGRTGISHLLMGSVAEKVVRRASCPVLTVHGPPHGDDEEGTSGTGARR